MNTFWTQRCESDKLRNYLFRASQKFIFMYTNDVESFTIKKQICVNILEDFIRKHDDNERRRSAEDLMYKLKAQSHNVALNV